MTVAAALHRVTDVTYQLARVSFRHPAPGAEPTIVNVGRPWWTGTLTVGETDAGSIDEGGPVLDKGDKIEVPLGIFPRLERGDRALNVSIQSASAAGWVLTGALPSDIKVGDFLRAGAAGRLVRILGLGATIRVVPEVPDAAGAVSQVRSVHAEVTGFPSADRSGSGVHAAMVYEWEYRG